MTTQEIQRKLATILSGDVKGYSRLLFKDGAGTARTLAAYKEMMVSLIQSHGGKAIDTPGDHVLAEFPDVMEAVQCAVEMQKELKSRNDELPEPRRMEFRFGLDLGEVLQKEETIFGDGVNIAVRIQSFADAGGICLSGKVYEQIKSKLEFRYDYLGKPTVQNIAEPVRIYRVLLEGETVSFVETCTRIGLFYWKRFRIVVTVIVALVGAANGIWQLYPRIFPPAGNAAKTAYPLPDKPSLAVMPFVNMMSDNHKLDLFCDGMTVEIINALSKIPEVFVIASDSMAVYKGKSTNAHQVGKDLGVRYVLEGSVRESGGAVRVTTQLIDAIQNRNLWSERYDRSIEDTFALQDEISMKVLTEIRVKLTDGEVARLYEKGTKNLQAYLKVLEGNGYLQQANKESNAVALRLYREAIALDPNYAMAYIRQTYGLTYSLYYGGSESSKEVVLSNAMTSVEKAIALDDSSAGAAALSQVYRMMLQTEKAIEAGQRAIKLDPNSPSAAYSLANALLLSGKAEDAIPLYQQAIRLNPLVSGYHMQYGAACRVIGKYDESISAFKESIKLTPDSLLSNINLVYTYMLAKREKDARATVAEVYRIDPNFSLDNWSKMLPMKEGPGKDRYIDNLRKAGLK